MIMSIVHVTLQIVINLLLYNSILNPFISSLNSKYYKVVHSQTQYDDML
jgi:hypothetical protein